MQLSEACSGADPQVPPEICIDFTRCAIRFLDFLEDAPGVLAVIFGPRRLASGRALNA